ncbi:MAG TPA: HEAT repeat domain-containing protein [Planctomycetaceae bacterium]|nr:HEAT repeat domain-containing protein [Planctomycetaceae bacterium]
MQALLEHARQLGADEVQLKGDRRAAEKRWFGPDALGDRFHRRKLEIQRRLVDLFERWGLCLAKILAANELGHPWEFAGGEILFSRLEAAEVDPRVQRAALAAAATGLLATPADQDLGIDLNTLALIKAWSRDVWRDVWVQAEAQRLLAILDAGDFFELFQERLKSNGPGDDFFVRARLLHRLSDLDRRGLNSWDLLELVRQDPSEFVRQEACSVLSAESVFHGLPWLRKFALEDQSPRVRATALASLRATVGTAEWRSTSVVELLSDALTRERDGFVLRVAARVASDWLTDVIRIVSPEASEDPPGLAVICEHVRTQIIPRLGQLRTSVENVPLRRQLALESERLWMLTTLRIRHAVSEIRTEWRTFVRPGKARRFPRKYLKELGHDLGRALAVLAQDDYGYELERGWWNWRLRRGERNGLRIWRVLHEFRTPSPDKRQAHDHTVGRYSKAELRAPSAIMSELSETKVPGEPLHVSHEGNWKPFLPLLDDVLSTVSGISHSQPVRFYSSAGITILTPPKSIFARCRAFLQITLSFSRLAALRNWRSDSQHQPNEYVSELRSLGFELRFDPYEVDTQTTVRDESVERYFSPALLFAASTIIDRLNQFFSNLLSYFHSPYQNTMWHLSLFVAGMMILFFGRHFYVNRRFRRQRNSIPLSIGGWGTRGKSGTERLKAALLCSQGYSVVSKSTGCEAMFMLSSPMGRLTELFLFRPYDKATIWEQLDVIELAHDWGADVFLWECMGLSPTYVEILQRQWMRDDITTITNTYPDHEDLQGPSGADVARSISGFVPLKSHAITTEREMRPLLEEAARAAQTRLMPVEWMEPGLIAQDVIARFPYDEHPDNIALVSKMAAELGIPRDVALKAMADELVADLGVLKTFPPALVQTRTIEFTNGMSANERLGCLGNWERLEFHWNQPAQEPGVFITTVVNNRADRVARSRVFAELIVNDLNADRHILIGNNLKGMQGYIAEARDRAVDDLHLWPDHQLSADRSPEQTLKEICNRHRWPTGPQHVQDRLAVMLTALLPESKSLSTRTELLEDWREIGSLTERIRQLDADEELASAVLEYHSQAVKALSEYERILTRVKNSRPEQHAEITREFRELLKTWLIKKIVVVEDYHASGEQVIQQIVEATPPGFRNRVMGIQNIKGTGLDFVYRFQAWNACHALCRRLLSTDKTDALAALRELSQYADFGLLSEKCTLDSITHAEQSPAFVDHKLKHELAILRDRVTSQLSNIRETFGGHHHKSEWKQALLNLIEQFLDLGDAIRRRKRAEQIYRDILSERISLDRAAAMLRDLTKRQKGGWLAAWFGKQ